MTSYSIHALTGLPTHCRPPGCDASSIGTPSTLVGIGTSSSSAALSSPPSWSADSDTGG